MNRNLIDRRLNEVLRHLLADRSIPYARGVRLQRDLDDVDRELASTAKAAGILERENRDLKATILELRKALERAEAALAERTTDDRGDASGAAGSVGDHGHVGDQPAAAPSVAGGGAGAPDAGGSRKRTTPGPKPRKAAAERSA